MSDEVRWLTLTVQVPVVESKWRAGPETNPLSSPCKIGCVIPWGIRSSTIQYDIYMIRYEFSKKIFTVWNSSFVTGPQSEVSMLREKKFFPMGRIIGDILALAMK